MSDRELLEVFRDDDSPWPLSTAEVSDAVAISDVYRRLEQLVDAGYLDSRKYGSARAYRLTDAGREYLDDSEGE